MTAHITDCGRAFVVGMVHGLAGSAALMLLVLTTIESPVAGFAYIAIFGVGSMGGMMLMSALVSLPAQLTRRRWQHADLFVSGAAGLLSVGFGVLMCYEIGFVKGLLL